MLRNDCSNDRRVPSSFSASSSSTTKPTIANINMSFVSPSSHPTVKFLMMRVPSRQGNFTFRCCQDSLCTHFAGTHPGALQIGYCLDRLAGLQSSWNSWIPWKSVQSNHFLWDWCLNMFKLSLKIFGNHFGRLKIPHIHSWQTGWNQRLSKGGKTHPSFPMAPKSNGAYHVELHEP